MLKNAKQKGTRNEHRSKRLLETAGYRVTRAAGSLGLWDLVGLGPQGAVVCEVKTRGWPGTLEMRQLIEDCAGGYVARGVHRWRDRQRMPDVKVL